MVYSASFDAGAFVTRRNLKQIHEDLKEPGYKGIYDAWQLLQGSGRRGQRKRLAAPSGYLTAVILDRISASICAYNFRYTRPFSGVLASTIASIRGGKRVKIDNSAIKRALRGVAIRSRDYLFAGADSGGKCAAAIYSLIGTAKLNWIDPKAWLRHVLTYIAAHPKLVEISGTCIQRA